MLFRTFYLWTKNNSFSGCKHESNQRLLPHPALMAAQPALINPTRTMRLLGAALVQAVLPSMPISKAICRTSSIDFPRKSRRVSSK